MKTTYLLFISLILASCEGKYVKAVRKFQGDWQIQSISYIDNKQNINKAGNLGQMSFGNEKPNPVDGVYIGKQIIGKWEAEFQYSGIISGDHIDIMLVGIDRKAIPTDAIGRVQVYNYEFMDNNTLKIYTDKEFDYSTNKLFTDVSYVLKR
jgi:hypothetical protein